MNHNVTPEYKKILSKLQRKAVQTVNDPHYILAKISEVLATLGPTQSEKLSDKEITAKLVQFLSDRSDPSAGEVWAELASSARAMAAFALTTGEELRAAGLENEYNLVMSPNGYPQQYLAFFGKGSAPGATIDLERASPRDTANYIVANPGTLNNYVRIPGGIENLENKIFTDPVATITYMYHMDVRRQKVLSEPARVSQIEGMLSKYPSQIVLWKALILNAVELLTPEEQAIYKGLQKATDKSMVEETIPERSKFKRLDLIKPEKPGQWTPATAPAPAEQAPTGDQYSTDGYNFTQPVATLRGDAMIRESARYVRMERFAGEDDNTESYEQYLARKNKGGIGGSEESPLKKMLRDEEDKKRFQKEQAERHVQEEKKFSIDPYTQPRLVNLLQRHHVNLQDDHEFGKDRLGFRIDDVRDMMERRADTYAVAAARYVVLALRDFLGEKIQEMKDPSFKVQYFKFSDAIKPRMRHFLGAVTTEQDIVEVKGFITNRLESLNVHQKKNILDMISTTKAGYDKGFIADVRREAGAAAESIAESLVPYQEDKQELAEAHKELRQERVRNIQHWTPEYQMNQNEYGASDIEALDMALTVFPEYVREKTQTTVMEAVDEILGHMVTTLVQSTEDLYPEQGPR